MQWVNVDKISQAIEKGRELLLATSSPQTVFYLSGGSTPKPLYEVLSQEKLFHPGAVGMIDERYGPKWHEKSNELMMKKSGLLDYLKGEDIPFHPILHERHSGEQSEPRIDPGQSSSTSSEHSQDDGLIRSAEEYNQVMKSLHAHYSRHVALLGMGADGHIAGLVAQSAKLKVQNAKLFNSANMVIGYTDEKMGERITQTFHSLSMMDEIFVLVLGEEKKKALENMKEDGTEEEIPARFLMRDTISPKVTIITDQIL